MSHGLIPHPIVSRYTVTSNDVLEHELRINVAAEETGRVLWYKDRQLGENEILEGDTSHSSPLRWVIHRPKRGWYIRLRAPSFPSGGFISLYPVPKDQHGDPSLGVLEFNSRSNLWPPIPATLASSEGIPTSEQHSYPPSGTSTPSSSTISLPPYAPLAPPRTQITKFLLQPAPHVAGTSLISRTLAKFRHTLSFALSPIAPHQEGEQPHASAVHKTSLEAAHIGSELSSTQLLTFVEAPHSTFATSSGILTLNEGLAAQLGVENTFWIAVALAYWEFLGDRESYIVATYD